jgi:hypothetical protein
LNSKICSSSTAEDEIEEALWGAGAMGCCKDGGTLGVLVDFSVLFPFAFWAAWAFFWASYCCFFFSTFQGFFGRLKNPFQGPSNRILSMNMNITFATNL